MAANGNGDNSPKRSGGRSVGFHKGSLGSPYSLETYGNTGLDPGDAQSDSYGPRIGPGVLGTRVRMEVSRNGNGRGRKSSDED